MSSMIRYKQIAGGCPTWRSIVPFFGGGVLWILGGYYFPSGYEFLGLVFLCYGAAKLITELN
jgi:hypothetical protein